jgi:hypothetical protein
MENKINSKQLMEIIFGVMDNKEKLFQLLDNLDLEKFKKGTISIHQDILNKTLYQEILYNLDLIEFRLSLSKENVKIDLTKKMKVMFMDLDISTTVLLTDFYLSFGNNSYGLYTNYSMNFNGLPSPLDKLASMDLIKDTLINSLLKAGSRDIKWVKIAGNSIIIDLNKNEEFLEYRKGENFGSNVISELELKELRTENERLLLDYKWID